MHGELLSLTCRFCKAKWLSSGPSQKEDKCPKCSREGGPRPDIVWFGEMPYFMGTIERALTSCDLFVSIGTSGAVYPAAGFVQSARAMGKATLELNLERSEGSQWFDETRLGPAGTLVPEWVEELVSQLKD
jgi:NAD-dependent deacetylase